MSELIYLWNTTAPYSESSLDQPQPSLMPYISDGSRGAVIVLAGGGYFRKTPYEAFPVAEMYQHAGISAFVLDYRIKPCDKMAPLADCNRAVKVVRSLGYEKVALLGFSAGGNAICCAATHYDKGIENSSDPIERYSSRPDAFIPCYAVISFMTYTHKGSVVNLLGNDAEYDYWRKYFSAELNVTDDTPTAFIWHCADDAAVPVQCAHELALALSEHKVPYEMHIFASGGHGLGLAEDNRVVASWAPLSCDFLERLGFKKV